MSEARTEILARIRQSTRRQASETDSQKLASQRLQSHPRGPLPAFEGSLLECFSQKMEKASASVLSVNNHAEAVRALVNYLQEHQLPARLVAANTPLLRDMPWPDKLEVETRLANTADPVVVSSAFAGIAETGTLALLSGSETPTTLNFLPDNYICLLEEKNLVSHIEDVWDRMRLLPGVMPRTLNLISGPSRTADVEQTIQLGAHGPRRLLVILIREF